MQDTTPADFGWLMELFAEGGVDTFWIDLDGDMIPDTQISSYDGEALFTTEEWESYEYDEDPVNEWHDSGYLDDFDSADYSDGAYVEWIPTDLDQGTIPAYSIDEYLPQDPAPAMDWSSPDCSFYDPFSAPYELPSYTDITQQPGFDDPRAMLDSMLTQQQADLQQLSNDTLGPFSPYVQEGFDPTAAYTDFTTFPSYTNPYAVDPSAFESTDFSSWDPSSYSMYDPSSYSAYDSSFSTYDPSASSWLDASNSYFTDYTFDNQLDAASDINSFWMNEYDTASDLSNQYWQMSADAANAGDSSLAYDYNQLSLDANAYADTSWSYADSGYSSMTSTDDAWYDAMSLDW